MIISRIIAAFVLLIFVAGTATVRAADIGGPFTLVDHHGNGVNQDSYPEKYQLIFFGYTYCPDICPTTLLVLGQTLDLLGPEAARVQALFITVDPARDTVDVLAEYVPNFHPDLIGLTGTPKQVVEVAKAFRMFYRISPQATVGEDYLVDHTSLIYLMAPAGKFVSHFLYGQGAEVMAQTIAKILAAD